MATSSSGSRFSKKRLMLAFAIAAFADASSIVLLFVPPVQGILDLATAILLFVVLGRQWIILPGLVMEAIPGLDIFPFWVLVVTAIAMRGTVQPGRDRHAAGDDANQDSMRGQ